MTRGYHGAPMSNIEAADIHRQLTVNIVLLPALAELAGGGR